AMLKEPEHLISGDTSIPWTDRNFNLGSRHEKNTDNSHPFVCSTCGRSYMRKCTLQRHIRLECGKEPNIHCPVCPYRTKRSDELRKHMRRTHNIDKKCCSYSPFIEHGVYEHCSIGDTNIDDEYILQTIMRNEAAFYSYENIYSEDVMKEGYDAIPGQGTSNIFPEEEIHIPPPLRRQNPASQPFVCAACGKAYMWKCTLQRHVKLECGKEANIKCPMCRYKTKRPDELKTHMKRLHPDKFM
ncbi:hypothetical protein L9F63_012179, partial [Diploptera punctata]